MPAELELARVPYVSSAGFAWSDIAREVFEFLEIEAFAPLLLPC